MQRVLLNNYYAVDYGDYCVLMETDRDMSDEDIRELIVSIQFLFETQVDMSSNPTLPSIGRVLERFYGFHMLRKADYRDDIRTVLALVEEECVTSVGICAVEYVYVDLYYDRERFCGPGNPERMFAKWIRDEDRDEILGLLETEY